MEFTPVFGQIRLEWPDSGFGGFGEIDKNIPIPLYDSRNDIILQKIEAKEFLSCPPILSEEEFASILKKSRMTAKRAIKRLVKEGKIIETQEGTELKKEKR